MPPATLGRPAVRRPLAAALLVALGPVPALAQSAAVAVPPSLAIPNYHRINVGLNEAIEAGAYVARAEGPSANWYNPAGLALSERTELTAASTGYELVNLSLEGGTRSMTTLGLDQMPSFVAGVVGKPVTERRALRFGFSLTKSASWGPSLDGELSPGSLATGERISLHDQVGFYTLVPALAVGYAVSSSFRVGASLGFGYTSLGQAATLSDHALVPATDSLRDFRLDGKSVSLLASMGVQWDPLDGLALGAVVRAPGIQVLGQGGLTYQSLTTASGSSGVQSTAAYLRDDGIRFEYRLPLEVDAGVAWRAGPFQIEGDLRWDASTGDYDVVRSARAVAVTSYGPGAGVSPAPALAFPAMAYGTRAILSGALGARYQIRPGFLVNAGIFTDPSPARPGYWPLFRRVDLYGLTAGTSWKGEHLAFSIGLGYAFGRSDTFPEGGGPLLGGPGTTRFDVRVLSLLYSLSYQF